MPEFAGPGTRLAANDISEVAAGLKCSTAVIYAVCDVEARGSGFIDEPAHRPKILFEAHVFGRNTRFKFNNSHPNISAPAWNKALYGAEGAHQYDRLAEAIKLDRAAALQSASWGMFQVLGENFKMVGYADVESFVAAMVQSERKHLDAFAAYCQKANLVRYLVDPPNFTLFTRGYNGTGQVAYYAGKLETAYNDHKKDPPAPTQKIDPVVAAFLEQFHSVEEFLKNRKLYTGPIDDDPGPGFRTALKTYLASVIR